MMYGNVAFRGLATTLHLNKYMLLYILLFPRVDIVADECVPAAENSTEGLKGK